MKKPNSILTIVVALAIILIFVGVLVFAGRLFVALFSLAAKLMRENPLVLLIVAFYVAISLLLFGIFHLLRELVRIRRENIKK